MCQICDLNVALVYLLDDVCCSVCYVVIPDDDMVELEKVHVGN